MRRATQFGIAVLLLALAVGALALWQRGSGDKAAEREVESEQGRDTVITFACMDYQREEYEKLAQDFEQTNSDIHVQFVSADEASGMQREGNTVTSDGNEVGRLAAAADTFIWYGINGPADWAYLLNLQPFANDPSSHFAAKDFYPGALEHFRWEGDLYGLPAQVLSFMIFYDKGVFDQAGVDYPEIGWTWDDFLEAAVQLTAREGEQVHRYGFVDQFSYDVETLMYQHGVRLWDDSSDPPEPLFDRPKVTDVLRRYTDLALTYEVMPVAEPGSNLMTSNLIDAGKAAMWTDFAYDRDYYALQIDLGLAPYPEDVAAANPSSVYGFFISVGTAHPDAAWRWLTFLSENYQPSMTSVLPGRRSVGEQMSWWKELDEETRAVYEYILAHPAPPRNPLNRPLRRAANAVLEGQASVQEALETAQLEALEMQAELAEAPPATPQPVAAPRPTRAAAETVKFAPFLDSERSLYEKLAVSFNESHPDIGVQIVSTDHAIAERAAGSDCFGGMYSVYPGLRQYVRSLQPLVDADADFELADYYASALDWAQQDGELLALPYEANVLMVYANLERFAEAGVASPEPGWSFEDFLDAAVILSDSDHYGFTTREGAYGDLVFVLERLGARLFDDSGEWLTPTFDDPTVAAALERYVELYRAQPLTPATPSTQAGWPDHWISGTHPDGVESGQVSMWVDYVDKHTFAPLLSFEVGVAPLPVGAQEASTEFNFRAYYISSDTSAPQACWEWLTFLTGQPEVVELLPARRSVMASPLWQERVSEAALPAYQTTLEYSDTPLFRLRGTIGYIYPWLDEAFQATLGGQEAESALREVQIKAEEFWACLEATWESSGSGAFRTCAQQVDDDYPLP